MEQVSVGNRATKGRDKQLKPSGRGVPDTPAGEKKDVVCRGVSSADGTTELISSMVVPVWVSSVSNPDQEHLTYALLDTMSDTTFILTETSEALYQTRGQLLENSNPVNLKLTTMTAKDKSIQSRKFKNLVIRGYDSQKRIMLPNAYSRDFIPVERSHIPTPETAKRWPHLRGIAHRLQPIRDCEVGLLIGYDCPSALAPRNCITGEGNKPFAVETDLGWSIVGRTDAREDSGDSIGLTYRMVTRKISDELRPGPESPNAQTLPISPSPPVEVSFVLRSVVKEEMLKLADVANILESDFVQEKQDRAISQEDIRFTKIVTEGIHQQDDGFFSLPLPFKGAKPELPKNKSMA
jgi:hypothetical protein